MRKLRTNEKSKTEKEKLILTRFNFFWKEKKFSVEQTQTQSCVEGKSRFSLKHGNSIREENDQFRWILNLVDSDSRVRQTIRTLEAVSVPQIS